MGRQQAIEPRAFSGPGPLHLKPFDQADQEIPIFAEFRDIIARRAGPHVRLASLERFAFYERTRGAFRVVATGEDRLYGNILLKKGVVRPGGVVVPPAGADGSG